MAKIATTILVFLAGFGYLLLAYAEESGTPERKVQQLALPVTDLDAPTVVHNPPSGKTEDGGLVFSAEVTDNVAVKSVILFYRPPKDKQFSSVFMQRQNETSNTYSVRLSEEQISNKGVEYYIRAEDASGNTLLHGFSFSPIVLSFSGLAANVISDPSSSNFFDKNVVSEPWWKNKWVWIGVGAVATIAAVSQSKSDNPEQPAGGAKTGSIAISGPAP